MSALDWGVLFGVLALFVGYGVWRGRGQVANTRCRAGTTRTRR